MKQTFTTDEVLLALEEQEQKILDETLASFEVKIAPKGLQIKPVGDGAAHTIPLSSELYTTLQIFFTGVNSISYKSFDYTTLRSLLYAHRALENIGNNAPEATS
ncbi:hypothetical protein [uncultured Pontibacter sp.]|uniref:hypothetical protein n=1 Tax=uncultured Pontibacter sp. TaxID=453356 RepID=UPI002627EC7A|nr:hypothetical protein [uncultured Pontibacter sp.]